MNNTKLIEIAGVKETLAFWLKRWRNCPLAYVIECVGDIPTHQQAEVLRAFEKHRFVAIKSGHGIGKSKLVSWMVHYYLDTQKIEGQSCRVPITGVSRDQLDTIVMPEIVATGKKKWYFLNNKYEYLTDTVFNKENRSNWFMALRTARRENPDALQGFHNAFFIIDEAGCHDDKTEIMTNNGWKLFTNLHHTKDLVMTVNPNTGYSEYQKPTRYYKKYWDGEMYSMSRRGADLCITPNHRLYYKGQRSNTWLLDPVTEIEQKDYYLPKSIKWKGEDYKEFNICGKTITAEKWFEFLGWYISEGNLTRVNGLIYGVAITQSLKSNAENFKLIVELVNGLGFGCKVYEANDKIVINNRDFSRFLFEEIGEHFSGKKIPSYILNATPELIKKFLKSYELGDGYRHEAEIIYYTSSKRLANQLQELILKAGYCSFLRARNLKGQKKWIKDHYGVSTCNGYAVTMNEPSCIRIGEGERGFKKIVYQGYVYCVQVPNGIIVTRRNGKILVSGNSIADEVFEVASGAFGDPNSWGLMTGNPTQTSGYFYNQFNRKTFWKTLHFQSDKSLYEKFYSYPYIDPMGKVREITVRGRQTTQWVEDMKQSYGENSNIFKIRVLGEFASGSADTVIEHKWIKNCFSNPQKEDTKKRRKIMGVDVARSGNDETAIVIRQGDEILHVESWHGADLVQSRVKIMARQSEWKCDDIFIDTIGVGAGLFDELRYLSYPVRSVMVSNTPPVDNDAECKCLRDWLYWKARKFFREHLVRFSGMETERAWSELYKELTQPTYTFKNGKIVVESKDEMKRRGVKSPNELDALLLTLMKDMELGVFKKQNFFKKKAKVRNWKLM